MNAVQLLLIATFGGVVGCALVRAWCAMFCRRPDDGQLIAAYRLGWHDRGQRRARALRELCGKCRYQGYVLGLRDGEHAAGAEPSDRELIDAVCRGIGDGTRGAQ